MPLRNKYQLGAWVRQRLSRTVVVQMSNMMPLAYVFTNPYIQTDMTQGQYFSGVLQVSIQSF